MKTVKKEINSGVVYCERINNLITYVVLREYEYFNFFNKKIDANFELEIYQYGKLDDTNLRDYEFGKAKCWCEQNRYTKQFDFI